MSVKPGLAIAEGDFDNLNSEFVDQSGISTQYITPQKQSMLGEISQSKMLLTANESIDQQSTLSTCSKLSFNHDPDSGLYRKKRGQLVLTQD